MKSLQSKKAKLKKPPTLTKKGGPLRRFTKDDRGAIAIIIALSLPVIIGIMGLGVDATNWYLSKRKSQTAVDAAALSGVLTLHYTKNSSTAKDAAKLAAGDNGFVDGQATPGAGAPTITPHIPPIQGKYIGSDKAVELVIEQPQIAFLAHLVFKGAVNISTRAVAITKNVPGVYCVTSLNQEEQGAIDTGGNAVVNMGCGMIANSQHNGAVDIYGTAEITASPVAAVGGVVTTGGGTIHGTPLNWQPPSEDPFGPDGRDLQVPAFSGCDHNTNVGKDEDFAPSIAGDIFVFCKDVSLKTNHDFADGIYIFDGADLHINATATVTGDNVTFIFTGSGSNYGQVDINGAAQIDLSATNYDTTSRFGSNFAGILFYQDQNAPIDTSESANLFNGTSDMQLQGALYFPNQGLSFKGNNTATSACLTIVSQIVSFKGNANMGNNCPSGYGDITTPRVVFELVE